MSEKGNTIKAYNKGAVELSHKFNQIGPRVSDIKRSFDLAGKENPKVLELGCGNGWDAKEILSLTSKYLGIDASDSMIRLARDIAPLGNFRLADMENFDWPVGLDIVFAFVSLLHLNKTGFSKVLKAAWSNLNEGGIFCISVKTKPGYTKQVKKDEFGFRTFYFYSVGDIKEMSQDLYSWEYDKAQTILGVDWLTVILRKK